MLNAYNIVFAAFLVAAGRIADLLGRKRLFELGIWLFTFASVLCAVAPSWRRTDTAEAARAHADLVITPHNEGVGMLEFHQLDRLRESGREAARAALESPAAAVLV